MREEIQKSWKTKFNKEKTTTKNKQNICGRSRSVFSHSLESKGTETETETDEE